MSKREAEILNLIINSGSCELDTAIRTWLKWDRCKSTLQEIYELMENKEWETLKARLYNRICFGTAGLRGRMRAGFDSMNELIVIQTAQGLAHFLQKKFPLQEWDRGVVIGYDGRYNSKRFAELSAATFIRMDIPVFLFSKMVATPFVPFTISRKSCLLGIMVTASHNPKLDNGYKVYWANGTQIIPPIDVEMQQSILEHLEPERKAFSASIIKNNPMLTDPYEEMHKAYYKSLITTIPQDWRKQNAESGFQCVYTAMHGVGYPFVEEAFRVGKLKPVVPVEEQKLPDPEFPTVEFPNPEEGKSALDMSMQKADAEGISFIIANDPDADRMVCAEKDLIADKWKIFSGNELGCLLGWWAMHVYQKLSADAYLGNCYMVASTVSSKILRTMGVAEGFNFEETLTGFKWMGNRAIELVNEGKNVLFAFEESIGYMIGMNVIDKDGVSAAFHLATMMVQLSLEGKTLTKHLNELYEKYGLHLTLNNYLICDDLDLIDRIFNRLRFFEGEMNTYPQAILDGQYKISSVRDLTTGFDDSQESRRALIPKSPGTQMITFSFQNGLVITLRTSGTEPKIKYYSEMCAKPEEKDWDAIRARLQEMVHAIILEFLEPEKNGLNYTPDFIAGNETEETVVEEVEEAEETTEVQDD